MPRGAGRKLQGKAGHLSAIGREPVKVREG